MRFTLVFLVWGAAFAALLHTPLTPAAKASWILVLGGMAAFSIRQRYRQAYDDTVGLEAAGRGVRRRRARHNAAALASGRAGRPTIEPGTRLAIPRVVGPRSDKWPAWRPEYRALVESLVGNADIHDVTLAQVVAVNPERGTCTILLPPTGTLHGSMERRTIPIAKAQQFAQLRERW